MNRETSLVRVNFEKFVSRFFLSEKFKNCVSRVISRNRNQKMNQSIRTTCFFAILCFELDSIKFPKNNPCFSIRTMVEILHRPSRQILLVENDFSIGRNRRRCSRRAIFRFTRKWPAPTCRFRRYSVKATDYFSTS